MNHVPLILTLLLAGGVFAAQPARLYVSPQGRDTSPGTQAAPFATVARAQQAVRDLRVAQPDTPVTVTLHRGTYALPEPLQFGPADSGTKTCPVVWQAQAGEQVIISGGRAIKGPWKRGEGNVWETTVPEAQSGTWPFQLLRVGEDWGIRARYPNHDPEHPTTGGWLFVRKCSKQEGNFGGTVGNIHNVGDFMEWTVDIPAAGDYFVYHYYGAHNQPFGRTDMAGRVGFSVDGGPQIPLENLQDTGGWSAFKWSARNATLALTAGKHAIRWTNLKCGGLNYDAFALCDDPDWKPQGTPPKPPPAGKHLLIVQAETFAKSQGKELSVSLPASHEHFGFDEGTIKAWPQSKHIEMHIFPAWGWVNSIEPIKQLDVAAGIGTLDGAANQELRVGNRYFLENIAEELDAPGEWYLDWDSGVLRMIPLAAGGKPALPGQPIVAPVHDRLIHIKGEPDRPAGSIQFVGLTFMDTSYTPRIASPYYPPDAAIWIEDASDCLIENCRFTRLGGSALNLVGEATGNLFLTNTVEQVGQNGVFMDGKEKTFPHDNVVAGCHMHHLGLIYKHVAGVYVGRRDPSLAQAPGNLIAHNDIHDVPRYAIGIKMSQGNNVVEFNDIRRTNLETNDTGGIESCCRDESASGNTYRYNLVLDTIGMATKTDGTIITPHYTWGIYMDDHSSHAHIHGNICARNTIGGVNIHGGRENVIENNILVDSDEYQSSFSNIGTQMVQNVFRRNILYRLKPAGQMIQIWGFTPQVFAECDGNLYWQEGAQPALSLAGRPLVEWQKLGYDQHSVVADPLFEDPAKDDYRLKADSPAWKLGFERIPVEKIGRRGYQRSEYAKPGN
ncbi:MAG: right-handed parallel beta-helix repeat-containing protein [Armatimonadetes bacterium]|nr:right-handed parallel beta-helix repeat-containing protein [Armatimonadota bacterium]